MVQPGDARTAPAGPLGRRGRGNIVGELRQSAKVMRADEAVTLVGGNGERLQLAIDGYQFPTITSGGWDANWVMVSGCVDHPRGGWKFRDPCLTTLELRQVAEWLETAHAGGMDQDVLEFTEPNLRFACAPSAVPCIAVRLSHESAPRWLLEEQRYAGVVLNFPAPMNDFSEAAHRVRAYLGRWPERGDRT